jgi:predicted ArsR family transcriptional regulator
MKREYGDELKERLVAYLKTHSAGDTVGNIALKFKISPPTIKTYLLRLQVDGKVHADVLPTTMIRRKREIWKLV